MVHDQCVLCHLCMKQGSSTREAEPRHVVHLSISEPAFAGDRLVRLRHVRGCTGIICCFFYCSATLGSLSLLLIDHNLPGSLAEKPTQSRFAGCQLAMLQLSLYGQLGERWMPLCAACCLGDILSPGSGHCWQCWAAGSISGSARGEGPLCSERASVFCTTSI